jgi:hypothetical protein
MLHFQGQVTCERILALLNGVGVLDFEAASGALVGGQA